MLENRNEVPTGKFLEDWIISLVVGKKWFGESGLAHIRDKIVKPAYNNRGCVPCFVILIQKLVN